MTSILIFLAVLSFLVFFHEMGHFLAAKACNIYVDRFSIGMPPRLIGFKWGETDYCIGALPIGGFVKMAGQEDAPLSEEEREKEYKGVPPDRWFNNKPVWQRFIVILAGPVANLILAVLLYGLLAIVGKEVSELDLSAQVGFVEENSPAASAQLFKIPEADAPVDFTGVPNAVGLLPGDVIKTMDGKNVENFQDLIIKAVLGGSETVHSIEIERPGPEDTTTRYACQLAPTIKEGEDHPRFGIAPYSTVLVGEVLEGTPAKAAGLKAGDIIRRTNGAITSVAAFTELVQDLPEGEAITIDVERDGKTFPLTITPQTTGRFRSFVLGSTTTRDSEKEGQALVVQVDPEFKEKTGLHRKDVLTHINGNPVSYKEAADLIFRSPGQTLSLTVERPRILLGFGQKKSKETFDLTVDSIRTIGIAMIPKQVMHSVPASQVIPEAFRLSWNALTTTVQTLRALVTNNVSVKDLGGPVMIFEMTKRSAQRGFGWLIDITALISINLAVFNLLPLPVLDGGLLVINAIEGIRRKPLNPVFLEKFQMAGFVFIIGLMLFVTFNDVGRMVQNVLP